MGKMTKLRQEKAANDENRFASIFHHDNLARKEQLVKNDSVSVDQTIYNKFFKIFIETQGIIPVRSFETFKSTTKNEDRRTLEMAKHMFGKFRVPTILNQVWSNSFADDRAHNANPGQHNLINSNRVTWRDWYITIATGGSFIKSCVHDFLTRKEAHTFLYCKHPIGIKEGLIYSIAKNAGATEGVSLKLSRIKITWAKLQDDFWRDVIRFFSRVTPKDVNEANDIIDWIESRHLLDLAGRGPTYVPWRVSGHGFTIESIRKKVQDWHFELRRAKALGNEFWEGHAINDFIFEKTDEYGLPQIWTVKQIKNTKDLAAEGTAQHHCVLSYKQRCVGGTCSIWSVRCDNTRKLTLEVNNYGEIVQNRGYANRSPKPTELYIVDRFAKESGLRVYKY